MKKLFVLLLLLLGISLPSKAELPAEIKLSGSPGIYTKNQWKADWPGCEFEGGITTDRVELTKGGVESSLRVNFTPGEIGPEHGGAGWRWPFGRHEGAECRYTVRFAPNFDFVKGGKLPGLCGGPENVSGGRPADGHNGFSARLMWRRDGRGEAYVYHMEQPDKYGHSFPFPEDFRFPRNESVHVRLAVTMNTSGQKDGTLRVWIQIGAAPERLMVEKKEMRWREKATYGVDSFYFETFYGGGDKSWAPKAPGWAEFSQMIIMPTTSR
jgi:hypothetical protein